MAKYSEEFKVNGCKGVSGRKIGYKSLAKKHGIKSNRQLERWVKLYKKFGEEGLMKEEK